MKAMYWVVIAVLCNAAAQLALKYGSGGDLARWQSWLHPAILIGMGLYLVSFILTVRIYALYPLSVISPLMAGAIFVLISLGGQWFFSEPVTLNKIGGMLLIAAGIALLSQSS